MFSQEEKFGQRAPGIWGFPVQVYLCRCKTPKVLYINNYILVRCYLTFAEFFLFWPSFEGLELHVYLLVSNWASEGIRVLIE